MFFISSRSGIQKPYDPVEFKRTRPYLAAQPAAKSPVAKKDPDSDQTPKQSAADAYQQASQKQKQRKREPAVLAEQIMTSPVTSVLEATPLKTTADLVQKRRFRHLPVVDDNGQLVGLLSDRDILPLKILRWDRRKTSDIMVSNVLTARPETNIREIARVMFEARIGAMPIVSEEGKLVGMITRSDILRTVINRAPFTLWT